MRTLILVAIVAIIGISYGFPSEQAYPIHVNIDVYYESLCPYSRRFITQQLGPTFLDLGKYMNVKFNPAGNAKLNDDFTVTCQHGEAECQGGIMTSCLLHNIDTNDSETTVPLVACIEDGNSEPSDPNVVKQCMADNQISQPSFEDITVCASGSEGMGHFVFDILRTQQLNPPKQYVPWVLFNGVHNETLYNESKKDLKGVICNYFLDNLVPECKQ